MKIHKMKRHRKSDTKKGNRERLKKNYQENTISIIHYLSEIPRHEEMTEGKTERNRYKGITRKGITCKR